MRWAAISHHWDDDVDLFCHYNVHISLFSVFGFPSFKEHIFERTPFSGCFQYNIWGMENNTSGFKLY